MSHRHSSSRKRHYDSYSSGESDHDDRYRSSRHRHRESSSRRRRSRTPERESSRHRSSSDRHYRSESSEKSHKRKIDEVADSSSEQEQKKAKLEAWKKKIEEQNLLKNLKEEKDKLEQQKVLSNSQAGTSTNGSSSVHLNFSQKKSQQQQPQQKRQILSAFDEDDIVEQDEQVQSSDSKQDEVDPLDAFMTDIHDQVRQLPNFFQNPVSDNVITMEDLVKTESIKQEPDEEDDEMAHQKFIDALKKKANEEPVTRTLQDEMLATSTSDDKEIFGDEEGAVDVDEYIYAQQNAEIDGPSNGPSILERTAKSNKKDLKSVDHSKMDYPPFRKNFFILPKEMRNLTELQMRDMRRDLGHIRVRGKDCPPPIKTWAHCGLSDIVAQQITELKYLNPYPIQKQAIPCIMMGRNVIGIAKTGSGKTLAFLLPMFRQIMDQPPLEEGDGPIALLIAPTRELAMQIYDDLKPFAKSLNLLAVCAYGGASIAEQIAALKRGAHIVVCTPGRMIDLLCANRGRVTNLFRVTYVVLDEADRMFDMGFGPQISRIVDNVRPDRQIVLFSATFPKPLEALAKKFLKDSIEIVVGGRSVACDKVKQFVEIRTEESKFLRLLELLGEWNPRGNILIFVDTQNEVGNLFKELVGVGYGDQVASLHGGMEQLDRDDTLALFKKREKTILIATSVASRGLHVENLQLVINYNVPNHYEDYVHRVGRTGRAEKEGTAYTFITPDEERYASDLVRALKASGNQIPTELTKMAENFDKKRKSGMVDNKYPHQLSGYVGTGFKFDSTEMNAKKKEMVRQLKSMGMENDEMISDLIDIEELEQAQQEEEATAANGEGDNTLGTMFKSNKEKAPGPTTSVLTPGINAMGANQMELEINDYPQQARYKVTHRDALYDIQDVTGASVTCKGIFVDPSRPAPPGERKLYLLIEAPDQESVKRARMMIVRRLEEASYQAAAAGQVDLRRPVGRFSIF
jgi:ATP-dependent RNA helicase DDX46/PRP5